MRQRQNCAIIRTLAGPWQVTVNRGDNSDDTLFNTPSVGALPSQSHTYAAGGSYNVLVTVSDGDLAASSSFQVSIAGDSQTSDELFLPEVAR